MPKDEGQGQGQGLDQQKLDELEKAVQEAQQASQGGGQQGGDKVRQALQRIADLVKRLRQG